MKGICHAWSRGQHFSPSMPGDRYLKLGSKSDHRAEISGNIVWYDALAPRILIFLVSCVGKCLFFSILSEFFAQNIAKYSFFTLHIVSYTQNNLRGVFRDVCEFFYRLAGAFTLKGIIMEIYTTTSA